VKELDFIHNIIRDVRASSKVEPSPVKEEGGQRSGSGQEIKGSEGINASSFGQSGNVYVLVGLMRLLDVSSREPKPFEMVDFS
jgi:hypothetical protein